MGSAVCPLGLYPELLKDGFERLCIVPESEPGTLDASAKYPKALANLNGELMMETITALLVHRNSETLAALTTALERQGMRIFHADSRAKAQRMLGGLNPVPLVFTDTQLPDGTWADILAVAEKASLPVNVIVVSRVVDTRFYVETIETGAFDFVAPPFNPIDLAYIVRSAMNNVVARRAAAGGHNRATGRRGQLAVAREVVAQATPS